MACCQDVKEPLIQNATWQLIFNSPFSYRVLFLLRKFCLLALPMLSFLVILRELTKRALTQGTDISLNS